MVAAAVPAANAHNAQAWLFRVSNSRIDVFADGSRGIGAIDPFRREMFVSTGCAIENCVIAGQAYGITSRVRLMPDPAQPRHAARIDPGRGTTKSPEPSAQIPRRHGSRGGYQLTERADREAELRIPSRFGDALRESIPDSGLQALSALRVGYADEAAALSPRRALDSVVVR